MTPAPATGPATADRVLAQQLVERIGALRHRGDGDYELALHLEPADLGRVELRLRLEAGVVHVHVATPSPETAAAVHRSLDELRSALVDAGLTPGALDVGTSAHHTAHHGGEGRPEDRADRAPTAAGGRARPLVAPRFVPSPLDAARGVDVLL
jgi:flagellar hook-length control protein FliK